ncbi:amt [Symbiodinium necroappetens]|uniref:Amt protein n=1 Tax=Symbiodinium necroappetens TaxID=1628268 RepID=A0A813AWP4_9DINO|nr:amt [Symbiodinium necroappetens]
MLANMTEAEPTLAAAENAGAGAWVLMPADWVASMTAGLGLYYGGLVQDTHNLNTAMISLVFLGIVTLTWRTCGFSWAFGDDGDAGVDEFLGTFDCELWTGLGKDTIGHPGFAFGTIQMTSHSSCHHLWILRGTHLVAGATLGACKHVEKD